MSNVLLEMIYDKDEMEAYINDKLRPASKKGQYYTCKDCYRNGFQTEFKIYFRVYWGCSSEVGDIFRGISIEICDLEDYV